MAIFIKLRLIRVVEGVRFHRMSEKRDNQMIMLEITQCGVTMIPSTFLILYIVQFIH